MNQLKATKDVQMDGVMWPRNAMPRKLITKGELAAVVLELRKFEYILRASHLFSELLEYQLKTMRDSKI